MGILDSLQNKVSSSLAESRSQALFKSWDEFRSLMEAPDDLTFEKLYQNYKKALEQSDSWKGKIAQKMDNSIDTKPVREQFEVFDKMTPEERKSTYSTQLGAGVRDRIAKATNQHPDHVSSVFRRFDEMAKTRRYLQRRQKEGKPFPNSMDQLQMLIITEKPRELVPRIKPKRPGQR